MTTDYTINMPTANPAALDTAIKAALPGLIEGVRTEGWNPSTGVLLNGSVIIGAANTLSGADQATMTTTATAHDPIILSIDKTSIAADGIDFCTINVIAPKAGAAAVTIVVTKPDGTTLTQAVTMSGGIGSVQFKTQIVGTYVIGVQNPSNRTSVTFTIQAGN